MLQSRSSYGKFKSRTLVRFRQQTVDDTTGKRITTTYTVDDRIDIVTFRFVEFFTVINHCLPAIMTCRESRNNIFESEFFSHCLEDTLVAFSISLSTFYISVGFEAQTELCIFFVTDTNINKLHQRLHDGLCFFFRPEFLTEVEVNRYRNAMTFCSFASQFCQLGSLIGDSGSDTGPVEPIGTFHDCIKIEVSCICFSNGRMCTVIDYFAGTHRSTCFKIVDTYAVATTGNEICFYTIFAQCVHS